MKIVSDHLS